MGSLLRQVTSQQLQRLMEDVFKQEFNAFRRLVKIN